MIKNKVESKSKLVVDVMKNKVKSELHKRSNIIY